MKAQRYSTPRNHNLAPEKTCTAFSTESDGAIRREAIKDRVILCLKEHEAGVKTADLCRQQGISEQTFYNWKAKFGGLEVSEVRRLKGLESEKRPRGVRSLHRY
jgi:putative transposase